MNYAPELQRSPTQRVLRPTWDRASKITPDIKGCLDSRTSNGCGSNLFQMVNRMAGRRRVSQGELLYCERDRFEFIYAVHSGSFKSTLALHDGSEQVKHFHVAGELLGLDGVADGCYASGAAALEDSEISMVSYAHLTELTGSLNDVQQAIIRLISHEIVRGNRHMVMLGSLNASQRLAAFLLNQSRELGARGYSAVEFHLKMTRGDIGSFLGLTLETISRSFTDLHQQRLLKVDRRHIVILDLDGLAKV